MISGNAMVNPCLLPVILLIIDGEEPWDQQIITSRNRGHHNVIHILPALSRFQTQELFDIHEPAEELRR